MTKSIHDHEHDEADLAITAQTTLERDSSVSGRPNSDDREGTRRIIDSLDRLNTTTGAMTEKLEKQVANIAQRVEENLQSTHEQFIEAICRESGSETSIRQALADGLDTIIEQTGRTVGKEMNRVSEELGEQLEEIRGRVDDQLTKTDERMTEITDELMARLGAQFGSSDNWIEGFSARFDAFESQISGIRDRLDDTLTAALEDLKTQQTSAHDQLRNELATLREEFTGIDERLEAISAKSVEAIGEGRQQVLKGQRQMVSDLAEGIALSQASTEKRMDAFEARLDRMADESTKRWETWADGQNARLDQIAADGQGIASLGQRLEREHEEMMHLFAQERERAAEVETERKRDRARRTNNSGVARYHSGDFTEARRLFEKAVELDNTFAEAFNNLGLSLTELGEHDDATVAFETAIELNPELGAGYNNLGYVLYLQENYEAAIEMYKEAIGNRHDTSSAYTNLGNAYQKLEETEKAVDAWRKALEVDPANERAKTYLRRFAGELMEDPVGAGQGEVD